MQHNQLRQERPKYRRTFMKKFKQAPHNPNQGENFQQSSQNKNIGTEGAKIRKALVEQTESIFTQLGAIIELFTAGNRPDQKKLELIDLCNKCRDGIKQFKDTQLS